MEKIKQLFSNRVFLGLFILVVISALSALLVYFYNYSGKKDLKILVTEPTNVCELAFSVSGTAPVEGFSCNKSFKDESGNDLGVDYKLKPFDKLSILTTVVNTGNTSLSSLTLEDPLSSAFGSNGAQNLNLLSYSSNNNSGADCTYDDVTRLFKCTGIDLAVGQSIDITFIVEAIAAISSNTAITNVSKVYNSSTQVFCSDSVTTTYISNICNYDSNYCEQVFRQKLDSESACTEDTDCVVETPKHLECVTDSCSLVDGPGSNSCSTDADCSPQNPTHLECVNEACSVVNGAGQNECSTNKDCEEDTETHLICEDKQCKEVKGSGESECSKDSDCMYKKCVNNSCTLDTCEDGDCVDECNTSADCSQNNTTITNPTPVPSTTPKVPATGNNDVTVLGGLLGLFWLGALVFFIKKSWTI